ncbi:MAG: hypothetical protein IT341_10785 [Chloroflexi bacterium]|nr:hypothetical protein [Chloroflexota bacterium]
MTGERIPHPDADPELYDLLTLVSGPWTEARFKVSAPRVVRARHWMTYAESLSDLATLDVDGFNERINDESKALRARTRAAQEALASSQIRRARSRLTDARKSRAAARAALLLDEDTDGLS